MHYVTDNAVVTDGVGPVTATHALKYHILDKFYSFAPTEGNLWKRQFVQKRSRLGRAYLFQLSAVTYKMALLKVLKSAVKALQSGYSKVRLKSFSPV